MEKEVMASVTHRCILRVSARSLEDVSGGGGIQWLRFRAETKRDSTAE